MSKRSVLTVALVIAAGVFSPIYAQPETAATTFPPDMVRWSIIVAGTITALQQFFEVTAFVTSLGILGFTVGFALQDTLGLRLSCRSVRALILHQIGQARLPAL